MDQVRTFSFQDGENVQNQSAADLFSAFAAKPAEAGAVPAVDTPPPAAPSEQSAADLLSSFGKPPVETPATPEGEEAVTIPEQTVAAVDSLEGKAKGRPAEKISEQTRSEILALIDEGALEGFEDAKYETKKDLQDLLEANKQKWQTDSYEQVKGEFYHTLSPAMQFVASYAEQVSDPSELLPLLTAIDNTQYVASLDVDNESHQEEIIRQSNNIKGIPSEITEGDIADLKDRGKLAERAKVLKPALDQFTQQQVAQIQYEKQLQLQQEAAYWHQHQMDVKQAILDAKMIDGIKFKNDHRDLAYHALSQRNKDGDLLIYNIIDNLLDKKDYETLSQIALMGVDKKAYKSYIQNMQKAEDASSTIRTLKSRELNSNSSIAGENHLQSQNSNKRTLARPTRSGFGL